MTCAAKLLLMLAAPLALVPCSSRAALIQRPTLTALCVQSTDIVEARLTRKHLPGKPEWADTFSATVLSTLAGSCKPGDRLLLNGDLSLYDPARTGLHVLLFLAHAQSKSPQVVDMRLIDSKERVRRYFQISNPGGLQAEGFQWIVTGVRPRPNGHFTGLSTIAEDNTQETKYLTLAAERRVIAAY